MNPENRNAVCSTAFTVTSLIHMCPALLLLCDVVIKICEIWEKLTEKLTDFILMSLVCVADFSLPMIDVLEKTKM